MAVQLQIPLGNFNKRIQELKLKYETVAKQSFIRQSCKVKSPKPANRTTVRQITDLFNMKFSQKSKSNAVSNYDKFNTGRLVSDKNAIPVSKSLPVTKSSTLSEVNVVKNNFLTTEDEFSRLSVKDKILLYTKFIEEMSKSNLVLTNTVKYVYGKRKNSVDNGEVEKENPANVQDLLGDHKDKCKQDSSILQEASNHKIDLEAQQEASKSAQVEGDILQEPLYKSAKIAPINDMHSTLSSNKVQQNHSLPPSIISQHRTKPDEPLSETHKRNNRYIQSVLPIEIYAPPKKIRRTRDERLARSFFPNQRLEDLFYKWLKENGKANSSPAIHDNNGEFPTSAVDEIKPEAITDGLKQVNENILTESVPLNKPTNYNSKNDIIKQDCGVNIPPIPAPRRKTSESEILVSTPSCSSTSSKLSDGKRCESGVSTLPKLTSDESQPETLPTTTGITTTTTTTPLDESFDPFMKFMKPLRKKKFRRMLAWRKDVPLIAPQLLPTSTDSDTDAKRAAELKQLDIRPNYIKRLFNKNIITIPNSCPANTTNEKKLKETGTSNNCKKKYAHNIKLAQKMQSTYTSPSISTTPTNGSESEAVGVEIAKNWKHDTSSSWPTLITSVKNKAINHVKLLSDKLTKSNELSGVFSDSFIDQGFETGSNELYNTPKRITLKPNTPAKDNDKTLTSPKFLPERLPINMAFTSTPIKKQQKQIFLNNILQSGAITPTGVPNRSRRRSMYDTDSRRGSQIMEVIREDQPFVLNDTVTSSKRMSLTAKPIRRLQFGKSMTPFLDSNMMTAESQTANGRKQASKFWMTSAGVTVALDIFYIVPERIRLLFEIFCQNIPPNQEVEFGIDDHKFSVNENWDEDVIGRRSVTPKDCSHYWFCSGDLALPFSGRYLNSSKIQRVFKLISRTVRETGNLHFGIDAVEFTYASSHARSNSKLSFDSNYSQIAGLPSGGIYGLQGRNSSTCQHCKPVSVTDSYPASDSINIQEEEFRRFSSSPFGSNRFDLSNLGPDDLMMPRNSDAIMNPDLFQLICDNEPLEKIFGDKSLRRDSRTTKKDGSASIIQIQNTIKKTQKRLEKLQERLTTYCNLGNFSGTIRADMKPTPENYKKIKEIVEIFNSIDQNDGIKHLSKAELENYMYILSRYANICLNNCINHMDNILDTLRCKQPPENELQKSHDQNSAALSEHQLRIQASLQRLNIPDWFRQYNQKQSRSPEGADSGTYRPGNFTRKRLQDSGRWAGLNSKTTSLSSLGSQRSDRSPLLLSPSAHSHHGGQTTNIPSHAYQGTAVSSGGTTFSRWSTSHLNSSQISPNFSQRSTFSRGGPNSSFMSVTSGQSSILRNSMRQPYMGWRSQEKLSQRTAHGRLASSLLAQQQRTSPTKRTAGTTIETNNDDNNKLEAVTPEIQSSIKEVTSAIVHYVNDQANQQSSRSTSPNSRNCWLESSFVGTRPLDSPQTPIIENNSFNTAAAVSNLFKTNTIANANANTSFPNSHQQLLSANSLRIYATNAAINEIPPPIRLNSSRSNNIYATLAADCEPTTDNSIADIGRVLALESVPERSLSNASLEDVLTSLLGLSTHTTITASGSTLVNETHAKSSTGDTAASGDIYGGERDSKLMPQQSANQHYSYKYSQFQCNSKPNQLVVLNRECHHHHQQQQTPQKLHNQQQQQHLQVTSKEEQQQSRRHSEGDASSQNAHQLQQQQQQNKSNQQPRLQLSPPENQTQANEHSGQSITNSRRLSCGDYAVTNGNTANELQIKCRNSKCDNSTTLAEAKKYYKSCHNCTHLYCSRDCRRAHWEKHRKACLHSRVSNLCRQVLAMCKDDMDSQRHLSLMARKGFLSQGRGVVRILFRSAEAAEGFIKHGFQCLGEASYVRWPDLMPAEMGLELYSELLRLNTEYKPESKMLIYVAICVVSEAPSMGQAPVRWERQLVSRCAKLKLCKSVLAELENYKLHPMQPVANAPETNTEVLILTFNPQLRTSITQREIIFSNIISILLQRGVILRRHYPEIFQRLQTFAEGQTDRFNPVTLHPRNSQTGQNFVCIIMPTSGDTDVMKLPSAADGGDSVTTIDVGPQTAPIHLHEDDLLIQTAS